METLKGDTTSPINRANDISKMDRSSQFNFKRKGNQLNLSNQITQMCRSSQPKSVRRDNQLGTVQLNRLKVEKFWT